MRLLAPLSGVVVLLALLAAGCAGDDEATALPEGRFIAVSQSLEPKVGLFAEPVTARVDVLLDRERYDPDRIDLAANFQPYEKDGDVRRSREDQGRFTHLRFEYTLRCLVYACLPEVGGGPPEVQPGGLPPPVSSQNGGFGERKTVNLPAASVVYDDPEKGKKAVTKVGWPTAQIVSRLNFGDTQVTGIGFPFEASFTPLDEPTYRMSPGVLAAGLVGLALLLLALSAALVVRALRKDGEVAEEAEPELTPLEKALRLVEWSAREGGLEERREALEALAFELDEREPGLARDARRIAWTPPEPDREAMGLLVEAVRDALPEEPTAKSETDVLPEAAEEPEEAEAEDAETEERDAAPA
jgi:hypothetical protein